MRGAPEAMMTPETNDGLRWAPLKPTTQGGEKLPEQAREKITKEEGKITRDGDEKTKAQPKAQKKKQREASKRLHLSPTHANTLIASAA